MKYSKGDMVKMRVPEKEILDSPIYTRGMIESFNKNPMAKITGSMMKPYGLAYFVEDWKGEGRAIREDWIANNRGPVLFI